MKFLFTCVIAGAALTSQGNCDENLKLLERGNEDFTIKFFTEVAKENAGKSVVMSAFSVLYPLAQISLGTSGESNDELLRAIGLPNDNVTRAVFPLKSAQLKAIKGVDLKLASKVYVPAGFELKEEFARDAGSVFDSEVQNIDFTQSAAAAKEINTWVEDKTNNRIKDLVSPDSLNDFTRLVLVNAIYFKGSWVHKFETELTIDQDFQVNSSKVVKIPFMHIKKSFRYAESQELDAKLLEMFYEGNEASFLCILPNKIDGLAELEEKLKQSDALQKAASSMYEVKVEVALPKFKIETKTDLKDVLLKLGVTKIFDSFESGLTGVLNTSEKLFVSKAIQKAFIEVNEEGAEAAAANVFATRMTSSFTTRDPKTFIADRPFYFALRHKANDLFTGVFYN